ncbi:type IV pilus modification PilV family protein [Pseudomonas entomophila]|jgi:type IV pilus assembly protein PilV|uniref:type IV pilus modification PilV family protein n=1 Tax=Pseudomonas entomophila TaxID=312306 RepID=UPI0035C1EFB2
MTFWEVLVAGGVISLGLFAAAGFQGQALQAADLARRESQATQLAQGLLERSRLTGSLEPHERAGWLTELEALMGPDTVGEARVADGVLTVQIHWPEPGRSAPRVVELQGRLAR